MSHAEKAAALFESGCNCSQAVFAAFCDVTGMQQATALRLASPLGAGMGRMRDTCGAVTGMFLVLGAVYGFTDGATQEQKGVLYERVQQLAAAFRAQFGTLVCRELLAGVKTSTGAQPEARSAAFYQTRPCSRFVYAAAQLLDEYLAQNPK